MIYIVKLRDIEESDTPLVGAWTSVDEMKDELWRSPLIASFDECYYLNPEYYYDIEIIVQNGIMEEYSVKAVIESKTGEVDTPDEIYDALGITHLFKELS
ncbi:hypothetical protein RGZ1_257 [Morganella phage vB_MmoM_Rgz1]|nr:hypothetical protein RGZ1_257 [Morganella phage vB_MmoM_Rgz1]